MTDNSVLNGYLYVSKAYQDPATGEMRWACTSSDTLPDLFDDEMTPELYKSFLDRIDRGDKVPVKYRSEFWEGGMPYPSIAHYSDGNGKNIPGEITSIYVDGNMLKAKGIFYDTPLGRACFKSLQETLEQRSKISPKNLVRVSIGFLDYKHQHKSTGTVFSRKSINDECSECAEQYKAKGQLSGLRFLDGHLIHLALTRVPVNPRTLMEIDKSMTTKKEDAASIVGDDLAKEIEAVEESLENPLKSLVVKSEDSDEDEEDEKKKKKKDGYEEEEDKMKSMADRLERIETMLTKSLAQPEVAPEVHPLDVVISKFKAQYDIVDKSQAGNLKELETVWGEFAEVVKSGFSGEDVAPAVKDSPAEVAELVKSQVEAAVRPLMEQIQMLSQAQKPVETTEVVRRGATNIPNLVVNDPAVARSQGKPDQPATPTLKELVRRSVGLSN